MKLNQNKIEILLEAFKAVLEYENTNSEEDVIFSKDFITIENRYPQKKEDIDFSDKYKVFVDGASLRIGTLYRVKDWIQQLIKILKI